MAHVATEADYLRVRTERCKARLRANAQGVRADVRALLDLPDAIRQHPHAALAIGGTIGLLTERSLGSDSERATTTLRALAQHAVGLGRILVLRALLA